MLERVQERAERIAAKLVARAKRRILRGLDVPGVAAREAEQGVVLSGRGLLRRMFLEPQLRWIGSLFR